MFRFWFKAKQCSLLMEVMKKRINLSNEKTTSEMLITETNTSAKHVDLTKAVENMGIYMKSGLRDFY